MTTFADRIEGSQNERVHAIEVELESRYDELGERPALALALREDDYLAWYIAVDLPFLLRYRLADGATDG